MSRLEESVCVVTGAAGGIGSAIAARLAADGGHVVVADLDRAKAETVAAEIESAGGTAAAVAIDVTDRASVKEAVAAVVNRFGRLDVIFNNAGISQPRQFLEISEAEYEKLWRVNSLGVLICMQEAMKQMIAQGGGGKVVNTASVAGKQGYALFSAYAATKFAVVAWTQSAAKEMAPEGITVNAFCPGVVTTQLWDQLDRNLMEIGATERKGEGLEGVSDGILIGRLSTPDDIVGLASFLASSDSDYITGQSILVDGGMLFS